MRYAAILIPALLAAGPAAAQDADTDRYEDMVMRCYADARDSDARLSCVGRASSLCQDETAAGHTTLGIVDCLLAETRGWSRVLDTEYRASLEAAREGDAAERAHFPQFTARVRTLREAQHAWAAYRDAQCAYAYAEWGSGSMRTIAGANCHLRMTAERAVWLTSARDGTR